MTASITSLGIAQGAEPLLGHAGADDVVEVEAHALGPERAGLRLADVVEERGEAHRQLRARLGHHGDRVGQDVLVVVDRVLLEGQAGQFGEELVGQPRPHQEPQAGRRVVDHQQLRQLVADPLGAHHLEPAGQVGGRLRPAPGRARGRARP